MRSGRTQVQSIPAELRALFPKPENRTVTRLENAETMDVFHLIPDKVRRDSWQVRRFVQHLRNTHSSTREQLKACFDFIMRYIAYAEDKAGTDQLKSPARLVADQIGDCDCYTVFLSSCMLELGVPHVVRMTGYHNTGADFSHVYVVAEVAGERITLDPVMERFNAEYPFRNKLDYDMRLQELNGLPLGNTEEEKKAFGDTWGGNFLKNIAGLGAGILVQYAQKELLGEPVTIAPEQQQQINQALSAATGKPADSLSTDELRAELMKLAQLKQQSEPTDNNSQMMAMLMSMLNKPKDDSTATLLQMQAQREADERKRSESNKTLIIGGVVVVTALGALLISLNSNKRESRREREREYR
jgi:hypothetical protein